MSGRTMSYEVETDPTDSIIEISGVKLDSGRYYVEITGLDLILYKLEVYGVNGAGRSTTPGVKYEIGLTPSHLVLHQADHVAKYDKSAVSNTVIRWGLDSAARKWTAAANYGLEVCDDANVQCNKENTDKGVVTVETASTTPDDTWAGCIGSIACVKNYTYGSVDEKRVGRALLGMDMVIEDPAYHCFNDRQGCGDDAKLYVWTAREQLHGEDYTRSDGVVLGEYYFVEYMTLHEFGHPFGLPDFYTNRVGYVNWDSRLSGVNATMNRHYNAKSIKERQDIPQLDAMYVRHSPHEVDNP